MTKHHISNKSECAKESYTSFKATTKLILSQNLELHSSTDTAANSPGLHPDLTFFLPSLHFLPGRVHFI